MDLFTHDDLNTLLEERHAHCTSIFLPTHRGGSEEDPIRWKNLIGKAEEGLVAAGVRAAEARELLRPARELHDDPVFWKNQCDGLALFLAPDFLRLYRLPMPFAEQVVVGKRFYVTPLLPMLARDGRFFVLALSQNGVRLLQGTRFGVHAVDLQGVPANLAEAMRAHDQDEVLNYHTRPAGGLGGWGAIYNGHGVGIDDKKDDLLRYFQQIDRGLHALLRNERAPVVVAAVEYLQPIYREANKYPHLLAKGIEGNPDRLSAQELHDRALSLLAPYFREAETRALAQYDTLAGTGRTSSDAARIVPAALAGQVETLYVARDRQLWGRFDADHREVEEHAQAEPGDEDLLNLAAARTLAHGRAVHVLDVGRMPGGSAIAAVYCLPLAKHQQQPAGAARE